ncbi:hypothetical protein V8C86DRAFT_2762507 [Haematococcus lacustris]
MVIGPQLPDPRTRGDVSDGPVELLPVTGLRRVWATKMGAGLQNLGNTCYMNSVLQCLAYLPPVASGVQMNVLHGLPSSCPLAQTGKLCTCCAISKQLSDQLSTFDRAIRPVAISTALPQLSKAFVRGRQEDAHEFLLAVLEAVERDIKRGVVELGGLKSQVTLIEELFMGRLRSQVVCGECGYCSNSYEQVTTLSLDVPRGAAAASLTASLTAFTKPETLDGANKYKCDRCKRLVRATKALSIHHEPNILVVHLKRFDALSLSSKISRHVDFGHTLDLAPYSCAAAAASSGKAAAKVNGTANGHGGTTSAHYVLQGLVVHQGGSLHSGHYLAYVRDGTGRFWCANDATVTASTAAEVLQQQAYLLFFSRTELRSLPPPPYVPPPPAAGVAQAMQSPMAPPHPPSTPAPPSPPPHLPPPPPAPPPRTNGEANGHGAQNGRPRLAPPPSAPPPLLPAAAGSVKQGPGSTSLRLIPGTTSAVKLLPKSTPAATGPAGAAGATGTRAAGPLAGPATAPQPSAAPSTPKPAAPSASTQAQHQGVVTGGKAPPLTPPSRSTASPNSTTQSAVPGPPLRPAAPTSALKRGRDSSGGGPAGAAAAPAPSRPRPSPQAGKGCGPAGDAAEGEGPRRQWPVHLQGVATALEQDLRSSAYMALLQQELSRCCASGVPLAQLLAPGSGERKRLRGLLPAPLRHQAWQRAQDAHQAAHPGEPRDQGRGGEA